MNGPSAAWKGLVLPVLALLLLRPTACAWTFHPFESLPEDLKRGVLSQDGIWNMLERNKELIHVLERREE